MGLGTGPLKVGMGPEYLKPRLGGIHGNPVSWNNPCEPLPTGTILLKPDQWKNTDPYTYQKGLKFLEGRESWELESTKSRSNHKLENKQSVPPAKVRHRALVTTPYHVTYTSGVICNET